ncbi:hypothetical protein KJ909_04190, partial [Patescibacteria group bacterium]|nr:hypothetical protein [Patescibacteria group bacterium]
MAGEEAVEKPRHDWNVPLKFLKQAGQEAIAVADLSKTKKLRGIRDISTLALAAVSDVVPGMGLWLAGGNALVAAGTGIAGAVDKRKQIKELRTKDSFGDADQAVLKKLGLTGRDIFNTNNSINELLKLSLINDSALGKVFGANKQIDLKTGEKLFAGSLGTGLAVGTLLLSEFVREGVPLPVVKTLISRLMTRLVMQQLAPRAFIEVAGLMFSKKEGVSPERAEDFVDVALSAMSATFVALTTGMMAYKGIAAAAAKTQGTQTETAPIVVAAAATGTPTLVPAFEHTPDSTATGMPPPTPTLEPTPTAAELNWQLGQAPTNEQLNQLEITAGGRDYLDKIPVNIDSDQELETVYRFNLDKDSEPDAWAVYNEETGQWQPWIWEDKGNLYKADLNLDGKADSGWLTLQDLKDNLLWPSDQGGGGDRLPLELAPKHYDLDGDEDPDLLQADDETWFIDKNNNFVKDESDLQLKEPPVFHPDSGLAVKLVAEDGQMWWRGEDGKLVGLVKNSDEFWTIDRDPNPVKASDFRDGFKIAEGSVRLDSVGEGENQFKLVFSGAKLEFTDKGYWIYNPDGNLAAGHLADGRTLAFDPDGNKGIMAWQYQLAVAHPDWTPDEVGKAAFLHQSEPINLNLSRPEPYQAPSGTLSFDQLAMGPRGGDEGIIMHDVHEVNMNLNATQVAQAAHIAVVNNNLTGPAM